MPGAFGKPRPAIVIQSERFAWHQSMVLLPLTSRLGEPVGARIPLEPTSENGLRRSSLVMIDKIGAVSTDRVRISIGRLSDAELTRVERVLATFLGFD